MAFKYTETPSTPLSEKKLHTLAAASNQGADPYEGVDAWRPGVMKKGELYVQLDFLSLQDRKAAGKTASQYFTTHDEAMKYADERTGRIDTRALAERLQVKARFNDKTGEYEHPKYVTVFRMTRDK